MAKIVTLIWDETKAYFFKGDQYIPYDIAADRADEGYPQPISSGWPGVFEQGIDAAVVWPNGKAYFFKGDEYIRYDIAADQADEGYPQSISSGWPGVFESDLDAAVVWPNGKAYFFKGDQYIRYDIAADRADDGYPKASVLGDFHLTAASQCNPWEHSPAATSRSCFRSISSQGRRLALGSCAVVKQLLTMVRWARRSAMISTATSSLAIKRHHRQRLRR